MIWAPLYGKDSLGVRSIVRSDTFFKFGVMWIMYGHGDGSRFQLGVGKTYFVGKQVGLRVTASGNYVQTIVDKVKDFTPIFMLEAGVVGYLF